MGNAKGNRSHAVISRRHEHKLSLDDFPTPPWATRALCDWLQDRGYQTQNQCVWEPACGRGDMVKVLSEYFHTACGSDIHDYGRFYDVKDFMSTSDLDWKPDFIITNPPFNRALEFCLRARKLARSGVAVLVRTAFLESGERWRALFDVDPPSHVIQFCERVVMHKGKLSRKGSTATAYCWVVWLRPRTRAYRPATHLEWFAPGTRKKLEKSTDYDFYEKNEENA